MIQIMISVKPYVYETDTPALFNKKKYSEYLVMHDLWWWVSNIKPKKNFQIWYLS